MTMISMGPWPLVMLIVQLVVLVATTTMTTPVQAFSSMAIATTTTTTTTTMKKNGQQQPYRQESRCIVLFESAVAEESSATTKTTTSSTGLTMTFVRKHIARLTVDNWHDTLQKLEPFLLQEAGSTMYKKSMRRIQQKAQELENGVTVPPDFARQAQATTKRRARQDAFIATKEEARLLAREAEERQAAEAAAAAAAEAAAASAQDDQEAMEATGAQETPVDA